jgi:hypothetical protein
VAGISLLQQAKELENQLGGILSFIDTDTLPAAERAIVGTIKHQAIDARLEVRDYEYAERRAEQRQSAAAAKKYLEKLQADIVKASESNLFGAADVALLSAHIQHIISELQ